MLERPPCVLVLGGGELGSAVAHRLVRSGMTVFVADLEKPTCIRTGVCFAVALGRGKVEVEGVTALRAELSGNEAPRIPRAGSVAVLAVSDRRGAWEDLVDRVGAEVLVDARMLKGDHGVTRGVADFTIGLGPGFTAGEDVDIVVETNRGGDLGRVLETGQAEADTGIPAPVSGYAGERVIRAPASGVFTGQARIGDLVEVGSVVGSIRPRTDAGKAARAIRAAEVTAPISGLLRGLVMDGTQVNEHQKIGDVDPRGRKIDACRISDKGRAVAGGVLEAIMHWWTGGHV
jgi:xanthine dehydrogenase accessory factor